MRQLAFPIFPFEGSEPSSFVLSDGKTLKVGWNAFATSSGSEEFHKSLYLVYIEGSLQGDYIKWANKITDESSIKFVKENYYELHISERAAVIRWLPGITEIISNDNVDIESVYHKTLMYIDNLSIPDYINNVRLKVHKHTHSVVGKDIDSFSASIITDLPKLSINDYYMGSIYTRDEYLKKVFQYKSNHYYDNSMLSAWDMKQYFEGQHEAEYLETARNSTQMHQYNILSTYSRTKHISSVFKVIEALEVERLKSEFFKLEVAVTKYNEERFPVRRYYGGQQFLRNRKELAFF